MAVSGLEMAQNSARLSWSKEEVDNKLKGIMTSIFNSSKSVSRLPHCCMGSHSAQKRLPHCCMGSHSAQMHYGAEEVPLIVSSTQQPDLLLSPAC